MNTRITEVIEAKIFDYNYISKISFSYYNNYIFRNGPIISFNMYVYSCVQIHFVPPLVPFIASKTSVAFIPFSRCLATEYNQRHTVKQSETGQSSSARTIMSEQWKKIASVSVNVWSYKQRDKSLYHQQLCPVLCYQFADLAFMGCIRDRGLFISIVEYVWIFLQIS